MASLAVERIEVHGQEVVGIAGVSGNSQKELIEVLGGQRSPSGGEMIIAGEAYGATRAEAAALQVRCLPEEPLRNASVARMSVAENLSFRTFDQRHGDQTAGDKQNGADRTTLWLDLKSMTARAKKLIGRYGIKTASKDAPISTLSGGNVQRTVLARELSGDVNLLIVANPSSAWTSPPFPKSAPRSWPVSYTHLTLPTIYSV